MAVGGPNSGGRNDGRNGLRIVRAAEPPADWLAPPDGVEISPAGGDGFNAAPAPAVPSLSVGDGLVPLFRDGGPITLQLYADVDPERDFVADNSVFRDLMALEGSAPLEAIKGYEHLIEFSKQRIEGAWVGDRRDEGRTVRMSAEENDQRTLVYHHLGFAYARLAMLKEGLSQNASSLWLTDHSEGDWRYIRDYYDSYVQAGEYLFKVAPTNEDAKRMAVKAYVKAGLAAAGIAIEYQLRDRGDHARINAELSVATMRVAAQIINAMPMYTSGTYNDPEMAQYMKFVDALYLAITRTDIRSLADMVRTLKDNALRSRSIVRITIDLLGMLARALEGGPKSGKDAKSRAAIGPVVDMAFDLINQSGIEVNGEVLQKKLELMRIQARDFEARGLKAEAMANYSEITAAEKTLSGSSEKNMWRYARDCFEVARLTDDPVAKADLLAELNRNLIVLIGTTKYAYDKIRYSRLAVEAAKENLAIHGNEEPAGLNLAMHEYRLARALVDSVPEDRRYGPQFESPMVKADAEKIREAFDMAGSSLGRLRDLKQVECDSDKRLAMSTMQDASVAMMDENMMNVTIQALLDNNERTEGLAFLQRLIETAFLLARKRVNKLSVARLAIDSHKRFGDYTTVPHPYFSDAENKFRKLIAGEGTRPVDVIFDEIAVEAGLFGGGRFGANELQTIRERVVERMESGRVLAEVGRVLIERITTAMTCIDGLAVGNADFYVIRRFIVDDPANFATASAAFARELASRRPSWTGVASSVDIEIAEELVRRAGLQPLRGLGRDNVRSIFERPKRR